MTADLMIIGGGFAACSALVHLVKRGCQSREITVLAGAKGVCGSISYGNSNPIHLLNAYHGNMGIIDDEPKAFTEWLSDNVPQTLQTRYVSRTWYGSFLQDQWQKSLKALAELGNTVSLHNVQAKRILAIARDQVSVIDQTGQIHCAKALLVGEGPMFQKQDSPSHPHLISPAWPDGVERLTAATDNVVILGTGLSGLDAAILALDQPNVSHVTLVSRDGRLPESQTQNACPAISLSFSGRPLAVLRQVRSAARVMPWRAVMDALRHQSNEVWRNWTAEDRKAALRLFGPLWGAHRNRAPYETLARIKEAQQAGRATIICGFADISVGKLLAVCVTSHTSLVVLHPNWLVDARGFVRVDGRTNSFCGQAIVDGYFHASEIGFGVSGDQNHKATANHLAPVYVVGAARLGDLIETTGVPEVRLQVRQSIDAWLG